jgi:hypothetical protein
MSVAHLNACARVWLEDCALHGARTSRRPLTRHRHPCLRTDVLLLRHGTVFCDCTATLCALRSNFRIPMREDVASTIPGVTIERPGPLAELVNEYKNVLHSV